MFYRAPAGLELTFSADIFPLEDSISSGMRRRFLSDHNALTLNLSWPEAVTGCKGLTLTQPSLPAQGL